MAEPNTRPADIRDRELWQLCDNTSYLPVYPSECRGRRLRGLGRRKRAGCRGDGEGDCKCGLSEHRRSPAGWWVTPHPVWLAFRAGKVVSEITWRSHDGHAYRATSTTPWRAGSLDSKVCSGLKDRELRNMRRSR